MFFLNLTAAEFFLVLGSLASFVTALYLLDRAKHKKTVSTLRFWAHAIHAEERRSRKKMREPWSLVLQLTSLLALLLALAQLQWGTREHRGSDHVVVLDTSSWTAERTGQGTVLDREKVLARSYIAGLPGRDRVMVLRADALTTPITPFTKDRLKLRKAIDDSTSAFSALNLKRALDFASQVQIASGSAAGEIAYFGPGMIDNGDGQLPKLANLRVIPVAMRPNVGIRRLAVQRSQEDRDAWAATVTVKNYARFPRTVHLQLRFAGTAFTPRVFQLSPTEEKTEDYLFVTSTAGNLAAELQPGDDLPADDRAELWLPRKRTLRIAAFTDRPEVLKPLLSANHCLDVTLASSSAYTSNPAADLIVLDQFSPTQMPRIPSLWIYPAGDHPPSPVKTVLSDTIIDHWYPGTLLSGGRYARDARLSRAEVFESFPGDLVIATVRQGPIIVARPESGSHKKLALVGFDPLSYSLRFQVTTPLLFADLLRWLAPEAFRSIEATADHVGLLSVSLDQGENPDHLKVTDGRGVAVPFTFHGRSLQLFTTRPAVVHIALDDRDHIFSLTLPDVTETPWTAPVTAATGLPAVAQLSPSAVDLWKWLALLGAAGLLVEWILYGRHRLQTPGVKRASAFSSYVPERARDLVVK
jgi:hypothetical protein